MDRRSVQRLVFLRAEDGGEKGGLELAQHDIRIGDGERAAAAIGLGAGIGAGAVGADAHAQAVVMQDRAAARRDGVDEHHGGAEAHARDHGFLLAFVEAVEMADIGGGAAHVEANDPVEPGGASRFRRADDAAGGAGEDGVLALEARGVREAAGGLHEVEFRFAPEAGADAVDVTSEDRGEIGIDHGGVAARDEFLERRDFVADAHLGEAEVAGDGGGAGLMRGIAVAVEEAERAGGEAARASGGEGVAEGGFVEGR